MQAVKKNNHDDRVEVIARNFSNELTQLGCDQRDFIKAANIILEHALNITQDEEELQLTESAKTHLTLISSSQL